MSKRFENIVAFETAQDSCGADHIAYVLDRSKDSLRFDIQISFGYKYAVRCHRHANNTEWHSPWFVNSYDGVFRAEIRFFFRRDP